MKGISSFVACFAIVPLALAAGTCKNGLNYCGSSLEQSGMCRIVALFKKVMTDGK